MTALVKGNDPTSIGEKRRDEAERSPRVCVAVQKDECRAHAVARFRVMKFYAGRELNGRFGDVIGDRHQAFFAAIVV